MKIIKRAFLVLIGFIPLLLFGHYLHHLLMTTFFYREAPFFLISVAVIAAWFVFGIISVKLVGSKKEAVLLLNASAFVVLMLILFQEWVLGSFWLNQVGLTTQMFYLPVVRLGFLISKVIPRFILPIGSFGIASAFAFLFMLGASYLGRVIIERAFRKAIFIMVVQ